MAIYVIRAGAAGPVKIGTTANLKRRIRSLQTSIAEPIRVLALMAGGRDDEFAQRDDAGVGLRAAPIPPVGLARAGGGEVPRPPAALTSPSSVVVPGTPHVQEHGGPR